MGKSHRGRGHGQEGQGKIHGANHTRACRQRESTMTGGQKSAYVIKSGGPHPFSRKNITAEKLWTENTRRGESQRSLREEKKRGEGTSQEANGAAEQRRGEENGLLQKIYRGGFGRPLKKLDDRLKKVSCRRGRIARLFRGRGIR